MLDILTEKIDSVFRKLSNRGRLTEKDVDDSIRQLRLALLGADVSYKVVKQLLLKVRERATDAEILHSLSAIQQITKIVYEEITEILGRERRDLCALKNIPEIILLVGLQGSGKTTTAAKLAVYLKQKGEFPLLVAADTRRPAARKQLQLLGEAADVPVFDEIAEVIPVNICAHAYKEAQKKGINRMIVDTQGRLHMDEILMEELAEIKAELQPSEVLLTVDAMTGQDAVKIAQEFQKQIGLTGAVLTKMDGDARGGAALSISFITGVPIKFLGIGENSRALEPFYPERLASRILNMGDMATFIERAEQAVQPRKDGKLIGKTNLSDLDLEDLLEQMRQLHKMGPLGQLIGMVPGFSSFSSRLSGGDEEKQIRKMEAIILSMTPEERHNPDILNGSRRHRISRGSGTTPQEVNQLLKQFYQVKKLSKMVSRGKLPKDMGRMLGLSAKHDYPR
jgi:signal recognition particle subunit SRP54